MVLPQPVGTEQLWEFGSIHHHRLVRTADGWRSSALIEELVWQRQSTGGQPVLGHQLPSESPVI